MTAAEQLQNIFRSPLEKPERAPLCIYNWMIDDYSSDEWLPLFRRGLVIIEHCETETLHFRGADYRSESVKKKGKIFSRNSWKTPEGENWKEFENSWRTRHYIKSPADYSVLTWTYENCEVEPQYENYSKAAEKADSYGIAVPGMWYFRTFLMKIQIDFAGTQRFCTDIALKSEELLSSNPSKNPRKET